MKARTARGRLPSSASKVVASSSPVDGRGKTWGRCRVEAVLGGPGSNGAPRRPGPRGRDRARRPDAPFSPCRVNNAGSRSPSVTSPMTVAQHLPLTATPLAYETCRRSLVRRTAHIRSCDSLRQALGRSHVGRPGRRHGVPLDPHAAVTGGRGVRCGRRDHPGRPEGPGMRSPKVRAGIARGAALG